MPRCCAKCAAWALRIFGTQEFIRHATATDYTAYAIPRQHPSVVKGRAGSPYAIADYYDIDPTWPKTWRAAWRSFVPW